MHVPPIPAIGERATKELFLRGEVSSVCGASPAPREQRAFTQSMPGVGAGSQLDSS